MKHDSTVIVQSALYPVVSYEVRRMSFGRRLEFSQRVRDLARRIEFNLAGSEPADNVDAAVLTAEIDKLYFEWGLSNISGIEIDGSPATPSILFSCGPEDLVREIVNVIKRECGLTSEERKN